MTKENTKHKFHEVLKWIADGEQIEYNMNQNGKWRGCDNESLMYTLSINQAMFHPLEFRLKQKITTKTISGTFFLKSAVIGGNSSTITLETYNEVRVEDFSGLNTGLVRIVSDDWYNELVSCKEQLDKLKF